LWKFTAWQLGYLAGQNKNHIAAIRVSRRPLQTMWRGNQSTALAKIKTPAWQSEYRAGLFKSCARLGYRRIEGKCECAASSNGSSQRMGARTNAQPNSNGSLQRIGACTNVWPNSNKSLQRIGAHANAWLNSDRVS
jgi:hypothetical protein